MPPDASAPSLETRAAATEIRVSPLVWRALLSNLPFALALAFGAQLFGPLKPLVVGSIMLLVPGLAWVDRRVGDAVTVLYRVVVVSMSASLLAWLAVVLLPGPTPRVGFLLVLAALTNLGLWRGARRGFYTAKPFSTALSRALTLAAALFYLQSYFAAAYFVPALEDLDMELQGTAYGLVHELAPRMTTNDESTYYFSHPMLLHMLIGESAFISGDLDRLRYYHDGAVGLGKPPADERGREQWDEASYARWEQDYAHFERDPVLVPTRTPNLFFSAFLLFPLGFLAYRLSGSYGAAFLACLLYTTLPEVYVRTAYGGYMAIANFLTLAGGYFYLAAIGALPERDLALPSVRLSRRSAFGAAFLGGWSDQKAVLLPLAAAAHAGLRVLREAKFAQLLRRPDVLVLLPRRNDLPLACSSAPWRPRAYSKYREYSLVRARPPRSRSPARSTGHYASGAALAALLVGTGFVVGWGTFIVYGLIVAPDEFIEHHLRLHVLNRLQLDDLNLKDVAKGDWVYPSILALWQQFAEHTGWLILLVAVPALLRAVKRVRDADGFFLAWVVVAAVGFSLVDWRQTKHLAQFLPAFTLLLGVYWAALDGKWRHVCSAVLGVAVLWNVWRIGMLMQNFEYLKPLPIW